MTPPLMPKATAVWLVDNTALTFEQIADFCALHRLEVQAIADEDVVVGMHGIDPIKAGEVTQEEIDRCSANAKSNLKPAKKKDIPQPKVRTKGARYTPIARRQDRPDAIAWLLRNHPELSDGQIGKLVGTTKNTINAVRDRTHINTANIKPQNPAPAGLGLCSNDDLEKAIKRARNRAAKAGELISVPEADGQPGAAAAAKADQPYPLEREEMAAAPPTAPLEARPTAESVFGAAPAAPTVPEEAEEDKPTAESVFGARPPAPGAPSGGGA
ncbi:MAG: cell cycle transcriptional regulator TrcR [Rhodospirillales bacterium]